MEQRPADSVYALIGRAVVRFVLNRYRTQIRGAVVLGVASVAIAAYLATRDGPDEG